MAKLRFLSFRLHCGAPGGVVHWRVRNRDVGPPSETFREMTSMTGASVRYGSGYVFFGFCRIRDGEGE